MKEKRHKYARRGGAIAKNSGLRQPRHVLVANSSAKKTLLQIDDRYPRMYYWCSRRSPSVELCRQDHRSFKDLPLRAGGHCVPWRHRTLPEQVCRNAKRWTNRRYNPLLSKSRCMNSYFDTGLHRQWNLWGPPLKIVYKPLQQECARGDKLNT